MRLIGSLGPAFATPIVIVSIRVKPPFTLAFYRRFLTSLRRPLGTLDTFSSVWRPTQTTHLSMSFCKLVVRQWKGGVPLMPPPRLAPRFRWLPPTLHIQNRITATGCSKAPRGLRFLLEGTGLCASKSISPGSKRGQ
jgi:hypothetical protein